MVSLSNHAISAASAVKHFFTRRLKLFRGPRDVLKTDGNARGSPSVSRDDRPAAPYRYRPGGILCALWLRYGTDRRHVAAVGPDAGHVADVAILRQMDVFACRRLRFRGHGHRPLDAGRPALDHRSLRRGLLTYVARCHIGNRAVPSVPVSVYRVPHPTKPDTSEPPPPP
jgi:hypothetical protein